MCGHRGHTQHSGLCESRNIIRTRSFWFYRMSVKSFPARQLKLGKSQETQRLLGRRKSEKPQRFFHAWRLEAWFGRRVNQLHQRACLVALWGLLDRAPKRKVTALASPSLSFLIRKRGYWCVPPMFIEQVT